MFSRAPYPSAAARAWIAGAVTIAWGLGLWIFAFGDPLVRASYDYLFLFTTRPTTNRVAVILMDNESYDRLGQTRKKAWDRNLHAQLLNRLADDGCPLVAIDVFFGTTNDPAGDAALAQSLRRLSNVVLMAKQVEGSLDPATNRGGFDSAHPLLPDAMFMAAARSNSGVAWFDPHPDPIVRKLWPFPSPGPYASFPWTAARITGVNLDETPRERWLRFYDRGSSWTSLPYYFARNLPTNSFRDTTVFIGSQPETSMPDREDDEFSNPFTRWTGASVGGVELHTTAFLNLVNHEWLERPPRWIEALVLVITGGVLGAGLRRCRRRIAIALALMAALLALVAGAALTQFTNYWFPWLIVTAVQVPVALVLGITSRPRQAALDSTIVIPSSPSMAGTGDGGEILVYVPDYEIIQPPFGEGAYGKVWLARNAVGQWQALKAVYRSKFEDVTPFEREFRGVEHFKPISRMHPGLLCIDFVSRIKPEGFFYYVMELGDSATPDWEKNPASYSSLDLMTFAKSRSSSRIPPRECVSIAIKLCDTLKFLHGRGLTHRDIKPRNIILVNGEPKFADVGLVADARRPATDMTWVGTPGYMPPAPEPPGTAQADIYALGMVLYVVSTGSKPSDFPELSEDLVDPAKSPDFAPLSNIIFKATHPDCTGRYASASDMLAELQALEQKLAATVQSQAR